MAQSVDIWFDFGSGYDLRVLGLSPATGLLTGCGACFRFRILSFPPLPTQGGGEKKKEENIDLVVPLSIQVEMPNRQLD